MELLTRKQVVEALNKITICTDSVRVKVIDYNNNPLAPEKVAYKVTFKQFGDSRSAVYYPNTVGFQFTK